MTVTSDDDRRKALATIGDLQDEVRRIARLTADPVTGDVPTAVFHARTNALATLDALRNVVDRHIEWDDDQRGAA